MAKSADAEPAKRGPVERAIELRDHITPFASKEECLDAIARLACGEEPAVIAFANAHAFNLSWELPVFASDLQASDLLLRDGKGVQLLFESVSENPGENLNGTDLIPEILARFGSNRIALFGTRDPWLSKARSVLLDEGRNVVTILDGFRDELDYQAEVDRSRAEIVVLAMGMPRQERVAQVLKENCKTSPSLIICGGAIVDFLAGRHSRAPKIVRDLGMEWLFRLALEPKRLFRRYVIGNGQFLIRLKKIARQESIT